MQPTNVDVRRKWYVMAAVAMAIFLSTVDSSIVSVALPTLVRSLHTDFAVVQWVVLAYLLTVTTLLLGLGRLADMIGKKPLYIAGLVIFTLGSLLCGLATTIYALIAFRVLQGLGAAMTMALGAAIVTEAFPITERGKALGISSLMISLGVIAGPTMGGIILQTLSWPWIFFVNLPVGVAAVLLTLRYVPWNRPAGGQRFDFAGALALFIGLSAFLLALTLGQRTGFLQPQVLALFGLALLFLILFLLVEAKVSQPMVPLALFKNAPFSTNLVTGFLVFSVSAASVLLLPFYFQNVLGYDLRSVGFLMVVVPLAMGITAPISGALSDRFGTAPMTVTGLAFLTLGYRGMTTLGEHTSTLGVILRSLPVGIGMGVFQSPNSSAVMGAVPRTSLGIASGLLAITRTLGQTSGIAVLGAVWSYQVMRHAGQALAGDATVAPLASQVAGLDTTMVVMFAMTLAALGVSLVTLKRESIYRRATTQAGLD